VTLSRKAVATLAAVPMIAMLFALDQTVVATALPHILNSLPGAALLIPKIPLRVSHPEPEDRAAAVLPPPAAMH
jgi:hypothetical protein